ncbi:hypothetical protein DFJ74DRAFT_196451 [Hyaloraphidium curvatum]|nr:hypothetical protein DFJ74DRAFT_196451 [Hyaloraphidium curvatum]
MKRCPGSVERSQNPGDLKSRCRMALLVSTVNRGLRELAEWDIEDTMGDAAALLRPQPFNEGKVFYRLTGRSSSGLKRSHDEMSREGDSADAEAPWNDLREAVKLTERLRTVERTFACLGFEAFDAVPAPVQWSPDVVYQRVLDLAGKSDWKLGVAAWSAARSWKGRTLEDSPPTFRVSLRFRGKDSRQPDLYEQLSASIARALQGNWRDTLPESELPWNVDLQSYDIEVWVHLNDDGIVVGLPLRPGRNVYGSGNEKGGLRESVAWCLARLSFSGESPALAVDPCAGKGTVVAKLSDLSRLAWIVAGDMDRDSLCQARGWHGERHTDFVLWDFTRPPVRQGVFDLVVSDLPFGHQHALPSDLYTRLRRSFSRTLSPGGKAVLLCAAHRSLDLTAPDFIQEKALSTRVGSIETQILVSRRSSE